MSKFFWPLIIIIVLGILAGATFIFFRVDTTRYQQVEQSQTLHIDTSKPLEEPNGLGPQDIKDPQARSLGSIFPYLAAPNQ